MKAAQVIAIVSPAAVGLVVVAFLASFALERERGLLKHLERGMAAGAFPYALVLIYGAIDPTILLQTSGINIPVVAGGLAILYVSIMGMTQKPKE
jgi:hypothetical protein